jgi:hypothetical protein
MLLILSSASFANFIPLSRLAVSQETNTISAGMTDTRSTKSINTEKQLVIYDHRVRWVAALIMALMAGFACVVIKYVPGFGVYLSLGFLGLFSLFWIQDLLFGFRIKLTSDGSALHWQEGKARGRLPLADIQKILIGVQQTKAEVVWSRAYIRFVLKTGTVQHLPPGLAKGLYSRNWQHFKRLVSHIRTVSIVPVEPIQEPEMKTDGWTDELDARK